MTSEYKGVPIIHLLLAVKCLTSMIDNGVNEKSSGICFNLKLMLITKAGRDSHHSMIMQILINSLKSWPKYSGDILYPITRKGTTPDRAYTSVRNKWDKRTTYGRDRIELATYWRDHLKSVISEVSK